MKALALWFMLTIDGGSVAVRPYFRYLEPATHDYWAGDFACGGGTVPKITGINTITLHIVCDARTDAGR